MAVTLPRQGWINAYTELRRPMRFLSRFFVVPNGGIYNGDKVTIDIERYGEEVAVAIKKCTGPNLNDISLFTTKEFTPPAYGEAFPLDVCELLNRMIGLNPYESAYIDYATDLMARIMKGFMLIGDKIDRAVELQASQVLQTGMLDLTDADGDTTFELDFKPKATHFPTVSIAWATIATATPLLDLESLAEIIRADGKIDPDTVIMDSLSFNNFIRTTEVKELADNRRIEIGSINPRFANSGATFKGVWWIGDYNMSIWTYPETYTDPQTGNATKFIQPNKVVMLSSSTRLDLVSARVPGPIAMDPRVDGLMPDRIMSRENGFDVTPNAYASTNGKQFMGELESRPLCIPVQIDGFGCLTTTV